MNQVKQRVEELRTEVELEARSWWKLNGGLILVAASAGFALGVIVATVGYFVAG